MEQDNPKQWYALRVTYGREMTARNFFDEHGIRSFVPMKYEYIIRDRKKTRRLVPAVSNLIFVYEAKSQIDHIKHTALPYLRYIMGKECGMTYLITISLTEMENFIRVASQVEQDIRYVETPDYDFCEGEMVKVIAGPFAGSKGFLVKIKGTRHRRVVVGIEGLLQIATAVIPINWIERA